MSWSRTELKVYIWSGGTWSWPHSPSPPRWGRWRRPSWRSCRTPCRSWRAEQQSCWSRRGEIGVKICKNKETSVSPFIPSAKQVLKLNLLYLGWKQHSWFISRSKFSTCITFGQWVVLHSWNSLAMTFPPNLVNLRKISSKFFVYWSRFLRFFGGT